MIHLTNPTDKKIRRRSKDKSIPTAQIEARLTDTAGLWETLVVASTQKGNKLQEAAQQQQYNRSVEDVELWLSELEGQLLSEDYGKVRPYLTLTTLYHCYFLTAKRFRWLF